MKKLFVVLVMLVAMNANAQWVQQNSGTTQTLRAFHFFDANTGIVYGNNGLILRTTNAGINWISYPTGITDYYTCMRFINDNTGYITGYNHLLKTTNKGVNWEITYFSNSDGFTSIDFFDNNTGYLFGYHCDYSFKTTNGGINWTQLCTTFPTLGGASLYYCSQKINDTLILVGGAVTVQHASPGASFFWAKRNLITEGAPWSNGSYVGSIVMAGNSGIGYSMRSGDFLKTTNFGFAWNIIPALWGGMSFYNENLGLYKSKVGNYYRISYSTNQGTTWILKDSILSYNTLYLMEYITPNIAVVVGDSGKILRNNSLTIGIENISTEIPSKYSILQNYPNPFNPMTNVKFSMLNAGNVKLVVYDVQGREVQTLVNEKLQPGTYEAAFDASALNSGVYFYKLVSGSFTETKKMLLIK